MTTETEITAICSNCHLYPISHELSDYCDDCINEAVAIAEFGAAFEVYEKEVWEDLFQQKYLKENQYIDNIPF